MAQEILRVKLIMCESISCVDRTWRFGRLAGAGVHMGRHRPWGVWAGGVLVGWLGLEMGLGSPWGALCLRPWNFCL